MATASAIFDRVNILNAIQNACLLAGGRSAVVLGAHKVGKSYLLDHIYREFSTIPDTIFCRLNLDMLKVWAEGAPLTDDAFYVYLVERLNDRLSYWIETRSEQESEWQQEIDDVATELAALTGSDVDWPGHSQELRRQQDLRRRQIADLAKLREVGAISETLTHKPQLRVRDIITLLDRLQRINKRVLLFIDDYQRLIGESGLTNDLFSFLRAANNDGTIVALASSPVHLMDTSLHPDCDERSSLFNHFNVQVLEPFTSQEADEFLQWPANETGALKAEEREYVWSLAGGAPFFLKTVRDHFVQKGQPSDADCRRTFEASLVPLVEGGFRGLWRRCTAAQRTMLREVVAGRAIATGATDAVSLSRDGYLALSGASAKVFSPLFASFIRDRAEEVPEPDIQASAQRTYDVFLSALAFAQPDKQNAQVLTFTLRNPTSRPATVRLSFELQGYAPPVSKTVPLAPGEQQVVDGTVVLDSAQFRRLTEPDVAQLQYSIEVVDPSPRPIRQDVVTVRLLARDHFVFARRDAGRQKKIIDYTWLIAAWVQRNDPALHAVRESARARAALVGYQAGDPAAVRAQVNALYDAVQEHRIEYDSNTLIFHQNENDFAQRVRLPHQVLAEHAANCLDASVLFATLMIASDLAPLIVFVPGHAFVGWKTTAAADASLEFLETTVAGRAPFEQAVADGRARFEDVEPLFKEWRTNRPDTIADVRRFAIGVDIQEVLGKKWIRPIS